MRKKLILLLTVMLVCLWAAVAQSTLIVDTGNPEKAWESGMALTKTEWLAGEITLDQAYTVTQVQGLIGYMDDRFDGDINAVLYAPNINNFPGEALFSQTFTSSTPGWFTWQGPDNLDWFLPAGTYWLAFEVDASSTFDGSMEDDNAVNPLDRYAYSLNGSGTYSNEYPNMNVGFRVNADAAHAPIPGALWLVGSGLAGLIGLRRKFSG